MFKNASTYSGKFVITMAKKVSNVTHDVSEAIIARLQAASRIKNKKTTGEVDFRVREMVRRSMDVDESLMEFVDLKAWEQLRGKWDIVHYLYSPTPVQDDFNNYPKNLFFARHQDTGEEVVMGPNDVRTLFPGRKKEISLLQKDRKDVYQDCPVLLINLKSIEFTRQTTDALNKLLTTDKEPLIKPLASLVFLSDNLKPEERIKVREVVDEVNSDSGITSDSEKFTISSAGKRRFNHAQLTKMARRLAEISYNEVRADVDRQDRYTIAQNARKTARGDVAEAVEKEITTRTKRRIARDGYNCSSILELECLRRKIEQKNPLFGLSQLVPPDSE